MSDDSDEWDEPVYGPEVAFSATVRCSDVDNDDCDVDSDDTTAQRMLVITPRKVPPRLMTVNPRTKSSRQLWAPRSVRLKQVVALCAPYVLRLHARDADCMRGSLCVFVCVFDCPGGHGGASKVVAS